MADDCAASGSSRSRVTTFGSDPLNDIVFPASAPPRTGTFEMRNGKVTVKAAEGVTFQLDGKPMTTAELKSGRAGACRSSCRSGTICSSGCTTAASACRFACATRTARCERISPASSWFPIDPAYRVEAPTRLTRSRRSSMCRVLSATSTRCRFPGIVTFTLNGQEYKLEPFAEPGDEQFWFIFRDLTSQKETYPAARFLYAPAPVNGKMILDFNKAENPPCAYNPYTTCPLPTEQNRLRTRIEAGRNMKLESKK